MAATTYRTGRNTGTPVGYRRASYYLQLLSRCGGAGGLDNLAAIIWTIRYFGSIPNPIFIHPTLPAGVLPNSLLAKLYTLIRRLVARTTNSEIDMITRRLSCSTWYSRMKSSRARLRRHSSFGAGLLVGLVKLTRNGPIDVSW